MTKTERRPKSLFYPFLFALFPALFLFTHNIEEASLGVLFLPVAMSLILTGLVWLGARLTIKERTKVCLFTFILSFMFFSYGHVYQLLKKPLFDRHKLSEGAFLIIWGVLFSALAYLAIRTKKSLTGLSTFLNIFVSTLILFAFIQIGLFFVSSWKSPHLKTEIPDSLPRAGAAFRPEELPDIYYLIFDRYANEDILKNYYDFDNGEFIKYLEGKGFYDASASRCNYFSTQYSLASSLNMEYLNDLLARGPVRRRVFYQLIRDFKVRRLLKSLGYRHFHFGSWYEGTRVNRYADLNFRGKGLIPLSQDFLKNFLQTTVLFQLVRENLVARNEAVLNLQKFKELAEIPNLPGPKFVFLHMLMPHHPFYFDAQGEIPLERTSPKIQDFKYLAQLKYTNTKIKELVDNLLAKSRRPPIIILQSDEGPAEEEKPVRKMVRMRDLDRAVLNLRIRCYILNAYYLPGVDASQVLYPSISPVNTFRVIFNLYFGTHFPLLRDQFYRPVGDETKLRKLDRLQDWIWTYRLHMPHPLGIK
jgi:hypothetical protein